jgi:SSS family solute:Na+ symporter
MDIDAIARQVHHIAPVDWMIIGSYILISIIIGVYYTRRARKSTRDYFTSGGGVPWWLLGTSMVATTFASDTPLVISGWVARVGISQNWFWWCQVSITMVGVFFFARLWRRAALITDMEYVYLRYSGKSANFLRGFKAIYFALPYGCIVMGWVNLAMVKIIGLTIPNLPSFGPIDSVIAWILMKTSGGVTLAQMEQYKILFILFCICLGYTAISGLWGVLVTDFFQFIWAMGGTILLAILAVHRVGGVSQVFEKLRTIYTPERADAMVSLIPKTGIPIEGFMPFYYFLLFIGIFWWSVGFTDGGSYLAQRMLAAKNERHAALGYLWYGVAHYCLRMWPWIIVGIVAAVMFPWKPGMDAELGYIRLNLAASYLINDVYRPFIAKGRSERHYVWMSIVGTVFVAFVGITFTLLSESISQMWFFLAALNSGIGVIYLLRWYWWRINAWTEVSCISALMFFAIALQYGFDMPLPVNLLAAVPFSLIVSMLVTLLTKPTDEETLKKFYRKVKPGGPGWANIAIKVPDVKAQCLINKRNVLLCIVAIISVYAALIGIGDLVIGLKKASLVRGIILLVVTFIGGIIIARSFSTKRWVEEPIAAPRAEH